ncbi:pentatricopeptide repeat-containing protein At5g02830, chloroplastic [Ipomoea triloba]|uniref:pentatricopeptide repeat-containing protein At5g02830, chloroplastic n=1 Tax=Ipomoea triloba TaxID=35885 RepID=UPI00125DA246|nr:pentatricopeptide repeat-containing protein At5g02830, chloroplastic [Ipomoea triloba]
MREALVILPSSSVSLPPPNPAATPPPHRCRNHRPSTKSKPKLKPKKKSSPCNSASTFSASSPPPPLLTPTPKWDSTASYHRRSLKFYAEIASRHAEDGRFQDFMMIVESVVVSGTDAANFARLLNVNLISLGIVRMIEEGKLGSVVELLSSVQKLQIHPPLLLDGAAITALHRDCQRIVKCGKEEEIVTLMETLQGYGLPIKEFVEPLEIIRLCVRKLNPSAAIRYAHIFPHVQILLCTIIHEFGKKGDLDSALTVFEVSKQDLDSPNMFAYRIIIDVCGLCGEYLKSRPIYEELIAQGATPNAYVFNSLMNVNACDLSYTLYLYKDMKKLGVTADTTSYNILLKSCCLAGRVDLAKNIYKEVKCLESAGALKLDVFTYSTLIKVFAEAKMWQMALKVKQDMLSAGVAPNVVTWSSLISACANAGLVDQAIQLFKEMLQAGCEPTAQCCNIILHACVEARQYDRAFRLFRSWKENGLQKDDYGRNAENNMGVNLGLGNCAGVPNCTSSSSLEQFSIRVPFIPTTSTYNTLMKACGTDYYRAKALMDEMKTMGLSPNHISWSILIDICGGSGNVQGALQILRSMLDAGIQPDVVTYTTAIKICVEQKSLKTAFLLFAEMKRFQIKPNMVTYNTLLRAHGRFGSLEEVKQCLAVYQDMRKAGYRLNDHHLKQLIEEWCEGLIQNRHRKEGQLASQNRIDLDPKSLLLEKVAEHLQKSNAESLSIDLQKLSKVEARILVLAVLRMMKETSNPGDLTTDDVQIILGVDQVGTPAANHGSGVKETIIELLQHDLGLEVVSTGSKTETDRNYGEINSADESSDTEENRESGVLPSQSDFPTRRPAVLQKLKITKESLHSWLQRRMDDSERQSPTDM